MTILKTVNNRVVRRAFALLTAATLAFSLTACASGDTQDSATGTAEDTTSTSSESAEANPAADEILGKYGLAGLDTVQVVDKLDSLLVADRPTDLIASVRQDVVQLSTNDGAEAELPMPEDKTYVSIAPYLNTTHDCYYHSLTTCKGELGNTAVQVKLVDDNTGEALVDQEITTFSNGFFGLWIPRDVEGTLTVTYGEQTGEQKISTASMEDPTCITTLQLK